MFTRQREALKAHGFDQTATFLAGWYNNDPHVKNLPACHKIDAPDDAACLLVANTRALWPPFCGWVQRKLRENPGLLDNSPDILDVYTREIIEETMERAPSTVQFEVIYAYETLETHRRCISVATAAHVAGLAHHHAQLQRTLHPVYGPWLAFRAVIVFRHGSSGTPTLLPDPLAAHELAHVLELQQNCFAEWDTSSEEVNWLRLIDIVNAFELGSEHRYSEDQIRFHYEPVVEKRLAHLRRCACNQMAQK